MTGNKEKPTEAKEIIVKVLRTMLSCVASLYFVEISGTLLLFFGKLYRSAALDASVESTDGGRFHHELNMLRHVLLCSVRQLTSVLCVHSADSKEQRVRMLLRGHF